MQPLAFTRRQLLVAAAAVLLLLFAAGRFFAHRGTAVAVRPPLRPRPVATAQSSTRLVVHVVGAVRRPGLYRLRAGARVADALESAGGATRRADVALVNLAAPLADGTQVVVPKRTAAGVVGAAGAPGEPSAVQGPVHLNTATLEELDALPGVGPVTAQKILDYRQEHGAFHSIDDLDAVPGIGPARLDELRDVAAP